MVRADICGNTLMSVEATVAGGLVDDYDCLFVTNKVHTGAKAD